MPRLRFSLKSVLISFAIVHVASYLLFLRPTVTDKRFVSSIESGDYQAAELLCGDANSNFLTEDFDPSTNPITVTAELRVRTWQNVLRVQRLVSVKIIPHKQTKSKSGKLLRLGRSLHVVAGVFSVRPLEKLHVAFSSPHVLQTGRVR